MDNYYSLDQMDFHLFWLSQLTVSVKQSYSKTPTKPVPEQTDKSESQNSGNQACTKPPIGRSILPSSPHHVIDNRINDYSNASVIASFNHIDEL